MMIFSDIVLPCIKDDIGFWKRAGNGSSSAPFFPSRDEALSGKGETKKTRSHRHKNGRKKKENANTPKKMIKKRKPRWMKRGWRRWPVDVHFRLLRPAVTKIKIKEKKAVSNSDFVALTSVARCRWRPARLTRRARKVPPPLSFREKKIGPSLFDWLPTNRVSFGLTWLERSSSGFNRFHLVLLGFYWVYFVLLDSTGFYWVLLVSVFVRHHLFYLVRQGFTRFYFVLLGSTGFYWVLLCFTWFYWVLLGFIGFDWVLLGVAGFYYL